MTEVIVDSNIVLDVVTRDPTWLPWSLNQLNRHALGGKLIINDIVFAEISVRFPDFETLDTFVGEAGLALEAIPRAGLFLAGQAFKLYRDRGGSRDGILPDFLIGAHAAITGRSLITRDRQRFRSYFPTVELITP